MRNNFFVVDTNTLISAALSPFSVNAEALKRAETIGKIVYSKPTWSEFLEVLFRKKFDKYFSLESRNEIADRFLRSSGKVGERLLKIQFSCRKSKRLIQTFIAGANVNSGFYHQTPEDTCS